MADEAREWTDEELEDLEKELTRLYKKANKEITAEWRAYMDRTATAVAALWFAYQNAHEVQEKADALKAYQDAVRSRTLGDQRYRAMVKQTTKRLARVNQIAADYINGRLPDIYDVNYRQIARDFVNAGYTVPTGTMWDIRNEDTMRDPATGKVGLPGAVPPLKRKLNEAKDMAWNMRQIDSAVLQGILQGESIKDMSKRILPIVNNNKDSAIRAARTMTTAAENMGRQDGYDRFEAMGGVVNKVWIATPDKRVRDWHLSMDGQEVGIHDKFVDGNGDKLMYPGDPTAPGRTVWNCRCTMRSQIIGYRRADGSIQPVKRYEHTGLHQTQIKGEKKRREDKKAKKEAGDG